MSASCGGDVTGCGLAARVQAAKIAPHLFDDGDAQGPWRFTVRSAMSPAARAGCALMRPPEHGLNRLQEVECCADIGHHNHRGPDPQLGVLKPVVDRVQAPRDLNR